MSGAQPDCEASFGGAVYEVSCRAQVACEIRIGAHGFDRGRSSAIPILSDQPVYTSVFAKFLYTGREDNQLGSVGQGHPRAVDCLVAQPCAVKLTRVEINDSLLHGRVHLLE